MSRGNFYGENPTRCTTKTLTRVPENEENIVNPFLQPPIAENHYKAYGVSIKPSTRVDRPAQTELSVSKHNVLNSAPSSHTYFPETVKQARDQTFWPVEKEEYSDEDYLRVDSVYESINNNPPNPLYGVPMSNLKSMFEKSSVSRGPDVERKKLEAELKAAQEIARLQQTIIEKRLALELASINNGKEGKDGKEHAPQQPHHSPKAPPDYAMMEEAVRRNAGIETNFVNEIESPKIRPKPVASISSRLVNSERIRNGFPSELLYKKTENYGSDNSSPNELLELQAQESKYYSPPQARMKRQQVPIPVQMQMGPQREEIYERAGWQGHQPRRGFSWRNFMGKFKKGFKPKNREDWEER